MGPVRIVRGFLRLRPADWIPFIIAWLLLGVATLLIALLPFTAVRRLLGEDQAAESAAESGPDLTPAQRERARRIGGLVAAAAAHAPWRSDCYPQALAGRTMLAFGRIPHAVCFGLRRDGDALVAHTWIRAGDLVVTGGNGQVYTEVGRFVWMPR
jgi:hypothetical protein